MTGALLRKVNHWFVEGGNCSPNPLTRAYRGHMVKFVGGVERPEGILDNKGVER